MEGFKFIRGDAELDVGEELYKFLEGEAESVGGPEGRERGLCEFDVVVDPFIEFLF